MFFESKQTKLIFNDSIFKKPLEMVKALMEGRKETVPKETTFELIKQKEKNCFFLVQKNICMRKKQQQKR